MDTTSTQAIDLYNIILLAVSAAAFVGIVIFLSARRSERNAGGHLDVYDELGYEISRVFLGASNRRIAQLRSQDPETLAEPNSDDSNQNDLERIEARKLDFELAKFAYNNFGELVTAYKRRIWSTFQWLITLYVAMIGAVFYGFIHRFAGNENLLLLLLLPAALWAVGHVMLMDCNIYLERHRRQLHAARTLLGGPIVAIHFDSSVEHGTQTHEADTKQVIDRLLIGANLVAAVMTAIAIWSLASGFLGSSQETSDDAKVPKPGITKEQQAVTPKASEPKAGNKLQPQEPLPK